MIAPLGTGVAQSDKKFEGSHAEILVVGLKP